VVPNPTLPLALTVSALVPIVRSELKRFVLDAVVAKKLVVVAFVLVEFSAVKFWRVLEPVTRRLARVPRPLKNVVPKVANVEKRLVLDAVVAKKFVEVALVVVLFSAVKFWRVDEPSESNVPKLPNPVKYPLPFTERACEGDGVPMPRNPLLLIDSAGVVEVANVLADDVAR
jgi:hypothetical protein